MGGQSVENDGALVFGVCESRTAYTNRRAAYAVILAGGSFACVRNARGGYFLPGGGAESGETSEETVLREIREEIGCEATITGQIGSAVQYFYAASDGVHYRMEAVFFTVTLTNADSVLTSSGGETPLLLSVEDAQAKLFHACHAWAVALASNE